MNGFLGVLPLNLGQLTTHTEQHKKPKDLVTLGIFQLTTLQRYNYKRYNYI